MKFVHLRVTSVAAIWPLSSFLAGSGPTHLKLAIIVASLEQHSNGISLTPAAASLVARGCVTPRRSQVAGCTPGSQAKQTSVLASKSCRINTYENASKHRF